MHKKHGINIFNSLQFVDYPLRGALHQSRRQAASLKQTENSRRYQCAICYVLRLCYYRGLYRTARPSLAKMSLSKRREVDKEYTIEIGKNVTRPIYLQRCTENLARY